MNLIIPVLVCYIHGKGKQEEGRYLPCKTYKYWGQGLGDSQIQDPLGFHSSQCQFLAEVD